MRFNWVIDERADRGHVDTAAIQEAADTQPEELSEGKLRNINEERGCDKKTKMSQRKWHLGDTS